MPRHCNKPRKSFAERFWSKVDASSLTGCWIWLGGHTNVGYGLIRAPEGKRNMLAHRASYEMHHGPIPDGMLVCHTCDNPRCVRPDHLFVGAPKTNTQDAVRKGRISHGVGRPLAKLTDEMVRQIRARYAPGYGNAARLGREYGVDGQTIRDAALGLAWRHVS